MKKALTKKLTLNKATISHLGADELRKAAGGGETWEYDTCGGCPTNMATYYCCESFAPRTDCCPTINPPC